ncbi:hypothetical protein [Shewanella sp. TC10]|uniref:hypothetical protein n=1 Tax=Shewanella sp. TC10 TaxID=1419739 RepID=UPI00129EDB93|nr:hypothetical protein [Shewanella sp. TC10]
MKFLNAKSHKVTQRFTYITWPELVALIETPPAQGDRTREEAKGKSPVIAAHDGKDKSKETALNHNNFTMLRLDLDDTDLELAGIESTLLLLGINSFIIHTTASHKQEGKGNRYRVYIELVKSLPLNEWQCLETYLAYIFNADDCASRPQQIMYLPFQCEGYEYLVEDGDPLEPFNNELFKLATNFKAEQEAHASIQKNRPKKKQSEKLLGNQISIISLVNKAYEWPELLSFYGYKQQGKAWLPPEATSKVAGAYILISDTDGKKRYYSHHESDPCNNGYCLDKFDFIVIRTYGGDQHEALKDLAAKYFPDADKHNKREWITANQNEQVTKLFSEVIV